LALDTYNRVVAALSVDDITDWKKSRSLKTLRDGLVDNVFAKGRAASRAAEGALAAAREKASCAKP
jgi:hypothetical protein